MFDEKGEQTMQPVVCFLLLLCMLDAKNVKKTVNLVSVSTVVRPPYLYTAACYWPITNRKEHEKGILEAI